MNRGTIIKILLLVFVFYGCSKKKNNFSEVAALNELVSLQIIRKDKRVEIPKEKRENNISPDSGSKNEVEPLWKSEKIGFQIEAILKNFFNTSGLNSRFIDAEFEGVSVYCKEPEREDKISATISVWSESEESKRLDKSDFILSLKSASEVFDVGVNIKTITIAQDEGVITSEHLVDCFGPNSEAHAIWHCEWRYDEFAGLRLLSFSRDGYTEVRSAKAEHFKDVTSKILGGNPNFDIQFNKSISDWAGQITTVGDLALTGHNGLSIGDANGDGRDDLFICDAGSLPNRLYLQQEDGRAKEVSAESGLDWFEDSRSSLFLDLDNDGDQDLVIATIAMVVFCENNGEGKFKVKGGFPNAQYPFSMSSADFDSDGKLDVYVCVYGEGDRDANLRGFGERVPLPFYAASNGGSNVLIKNHGNFHFSDVTNDVGLNINNNRWSFASSWEDFDKDGDPDLYVANDFGANSMYRNDAGRFVDIASSLGIDDPGAGMSVSWGDLNNDTNFDLYVGNMFSSAGLRISAQDIFAPHQDESAIKAIKYFAKGNSLFMGGNKKFSPYLKDYPISMGRWAWSSGLVDLNNDGWEDVLIANGYMTGWKRDPDL